MKVCSKCKKLLPNEDFAKNKKNRDGRSNICKKCTKARNYLHEAKKEEQRQKEKLYEKATGGIKIYILNHPARNEHKFNIVSTDEWFYSTDDKDKFLEYLALHI